METSPSQSFKRKQVVETTTTDDTTKKSQKVKIVDAIEFTSNLPVHFGAITPLTNNIDGNYFNTSISSNNLTSLITSPDTITIKYAQNALPVIPDIQKPIPIKIINTQISISDIDISKYKLKEQPDRVQVANYNVQPLITIDFNRPYKIETTLIAELIESSTETIIYKGFKAGDTQILASDARQVSFYGLKLNRLGHLRNQLEFAKVEPKDKDIKYQILIKTDKEYIKSEPFTLVSSFTQLPEDLKEKRQQRTGKHL